MGYFLLFSGSPAPVAIGGIFGSSQHVVGIVNLRWALCSFLLPGEL